MDQIHSDIKGILPGMIDDIWGINTWLYDHPELSDQEFESCAYLCKILSDNGFTVTTPFTGVATAFRAEFDNGAGPTIAYLAEYDALPGYGPEKKPGHACAHSWIAASCVGSALMLAKMKDKWSGKVVVFGCPAEETIGRKVEMVDAGAFKDVDAAFQFHPTSVNALNFEALALYSANFEFFGKASHAAAAPEAGVNALDAVILFFNGVAMLRQQLRDDARLHGIIVKGGEAANIIPDHCEVLYYVRALRTTYMQETMEKVYDIARGAAMMTGTKLEIKHYENRFDDVVNNPVLVDRMEQHMLASGFPSVSRERQGFGSTDAGNVSYACPTLVGTVAFGDGSCTCHEEAYLKLVNTDEARGQLERGLESMVAMALELYGDPGLVKAVRESFEAGPK